MMNKHVSQVRFGGQHAVVIGASLAGLLASRVLSDHFERVTIIERDRLPAEAQARKGVPQGRHVHVLLNKGVSILTDLFPDLCPALLQEGASAVDFVADTHCHHFGVWKAQFSSEISSYTQSRPFLEQHVRDRVEARANVRFIDDCEVERLCATDDHRRITGVHLQHRTGEHHEENLAADLVVDASGRGSQAPQWLTALGYPRVEEARVKVDVGYATRIYQRPRQDIPNWKLLVILPKPPAGKRGGLIFPIEGHCWIVTLVGWLRDYPPTDEVGFLDYARSLPDSSLYEAIKGAEPLTPVVTHKFPANQRRHYERLSRFPDGFLVLGDALCSFNPIYGQGMTVAALEASVLNTALQQQQRLRSQGDMTGLAQRCQRALAKVVAVPWMLATGEDFRYPETEGKRPVGVSLINWYMGRVHALAASNPRVTLSFYEVMHLLTPPTVLFAPSMLFAVLFKGQRRRGSYELATVHR
jgi:2-polyprenyl-6-methoxyphenol hydroxylase-like FAD-dependent oxidoreductase